MLRLVRSPARAFFDHDGVEPRLVRAEIGQKNIARIRAIEIIDATESAYLPAEHQGAESTL